MGADRPREGGSNAMLQVTHPNSGIEIELEFAQGRVDSYDPNPLIAKNCQSGCVRR